MDNEHALFRNENTFGTRSASCLVCGWNVIGGSYVLDLKNEAKAPGRPFHRFYLGPMQ